jgi:hypothetical protein
MNRRYLVSSLIGVLATITGCASPFSQDIDLKVVNESNITQTAHIEVGGTVTPVGATTSENGTVYTLGRDKVYFDQKIALEPGESRWFRGIIESSDSIPQTGVRIDLQDGPQRRERIHPGETNEGTTVLVTIKQKEFEILMKE